MRIFIVFSALAVIAATGLCGCGGGGGGGGASGGSAVALIDPGTVKKPKGQVQVTLDWPDDTPLGVSGN